MLLTIHLNIILLFVYSEPGFGLIMFNQTPEFKAGLLEANDNEANAKLFQSIDEDSRKLRSYFDMIYRASRKSTAAEAKKRQDAEEALKEEISEGSVKKVEKRGIADYDFENLGEYPRFRPRFEVLPVRYQLSYRMWPIYLQSIPSYFRKCALDGSSFLQYDLEFDHINDEDVYSRYLERVKNIINRCVPERVEPDHELIEEFMDKPLRGTQEKEEKRKAMNKLVMDVRNRDDKIDAIMAALRTEEIATTTETSIPDSTVKPQDDNSSPDSIIKPRTKRFILPGIVLWQIGEAIGSIVNAGKKAKAPPKAVAAMTS
jgi:hypothetical protein